MIFNGINGYMLLIVYYTFFFRTVLCNSKYLTLPYPNSILLGSRFNYHCTMTSSIPIKPNNIIVGAS